MAPCISPNLYKVQSAAQNADIFQIALIFTSLNFSAVRHFSSHERVKESGGDLAQQSELNGGQCKFDVVLK